MDTNFPKTLVETITRYADEKVAIATMAAMRWPNGVKCPHCGSTEVRHLEKYNRWECKAKHAKRQFTVKVGTVFEDSPIPVGKWLMAIWMLTADKNGISSYEIHRAIGVTQKSAWFMLHRIRLALKSGSFEKFSGTVEADEVHIGGRTGNFKKGKLAELRKMAKAKRPGRPVNLTRYVKKQIVMGMLERGKNGEASQVRTGLVESHRRPHITEFVKNNLERGSFLMTDSFSSYKGIDQEGFLHMAVNHALTYAKGKIHTNGLENFWALMQRMLMGTYVAVEPFHLESYLDEQAFRFNNRKLTDGARFWKALAGVTGKRMTYKDLTGKTGEVSATETEAQKMEPGKA